MYLSQLPFDIFVSGLTGKNVFPVSNVEKFFLRFLLTKHCHNGSVWRWYGDDVESDGDFMVKLIW